MKKTLTLISVVFMVFILFSCSETKTNDNNIVNESENISDQEQFDNTETEPLSDDVPNINLDGYEFRILSSGETHAWHGIINIEEETGDLIEDNIYYRNLVIEERFNIVMSEVYDVNKLRTSVNAGSDDYDFVTGWCDTMLTLYLEGLGYKFTEYDQYIDLNKPYWDLGLTNTLTFGEAIFFPVGAIDITTYDLIHVLLFNKDLISDFDLENPYNLVTSGNWTFDKYAEMVKQVGSDIDGNGVMDENDMYGLVSMVKYVLPCFWVAAGVETVTKTNDGLPQFTLIGDEKFASVIEKIFNITYDNDSWYKNTSDRNNYSTVNDKIFMSNHTLFFNSTFKMIEDMRSMETDFGIIPYPKYTESQADYYTRMEGCFPFIVPITVSDPATTGAIIEAMACESMKYIIPAYYEVSLKSKYTRDEESSKMLDIIFSNRVIDLGDSIWCGILRDGIFVDMFARNDRNLISQLEKVENKMTDAINKVLSALEDMES